MNARYVWCVFVCLSFAVFVTSDPLLSVHQNALQVQERIGRFSIQPLNKMKGAIKSEDFKAGVPDVLANVGAIGTLANIDYSAPPKEVFKKVGDSVIGIVATGLSMIPGGAIIGGVVAGIWGLFSPFLGVPAQKSPMEQMIDDMKDEMSNIKKEINELKNAMDEKAKEITENNRKETDQKISQLVSRAIQGALNRNQYVCSKYSLLSRDFVEEMKTNGSIDEFMRVDMVGLIHDCDNFLKDTAEAFVYPEYADVLWVPSVITTMVRVAFLSEVSNYGTALKMDPLLISMFFSEMTKDIRRHFDLAFEGLQKRQKTFNEGFRETAANLTESEYEGCKLQSQLLYFDKHLYPHGVPKQHRIFEDDAVINVADFGVTGNDDEAHHIQVYFNGMDTPAKDYTSAKGTFINCFLSTSVISTVPSEALTLNIVFVPDRSYLFRILFFAFENIHVYAPRTDTIEIDNILLDFPEQTKNFDNERIVSMVEKNENEIDINIEWGIPDENNVEYFRTKSFYPILTCSSSSAETCTPKDEAYSGHYVIAPVAEVYIAPGDNLKKKFVIGNQNMPKIDTVFGVELIALPKA